MSNLNSPLSKEEKLLAALESKKQSELIYHLVVKIIGWKSGLSQNNLSNKITNKEWEDYRKHILKISKTESLEKVKTKLKETQEAIKRHGGFA